jgi:hypothetical protein
VRCQFAHEDGAYVLGALSPAERAAFERHLATCADCRRGVAELAVLPGLLGRLPGPDDAPSHLAAVPLPPAPDPADARLPGLLEATAARRRRERRARSRRVAVAVLVAAGGSLVAGVAVGGLVRGADRPPAATATPNVRLVAMSPASDPRGPVTAEVGLAATGGGTEISLHCAYAADPQHAKTWTLRLLAYGPGGAREQVGSWVSAPGDEVRLTGITRFSPDDLVRLELVKGDGSPLLTYHVP